jgi:hypothetical protein
MKTKKDAISEDLPIDDLRDRLAKQILKLAIESDNPQYKVDAFKATERYGKSAAAKTAVETPTPNAMAVFAARVKHAEQQGNGEDAGEPATPDRG